MNAQLTAWVSLNERYFILAFYLTCVAMALDVIWKTTRNAKESTWLGSLDIETPLENLLYQFGKATGVLIDPYGKARLLAEQWNWLFEFAKKAGYPTDELKQIRAGIPLNNPEGVMELLGD